MSDTIPNGISSDDLKALMATAHIDREDVEIETILINLKSRQRTALLLKQKSKPWLMLLMKNSSRFVLIPLLKVLVLQILDKMIHWHEQVLLQR